MPHQNMPLLLTLCVITTFTLNQCHAYGGGQIVPADITAKASIVSSANFSSGAQGAVNGVLFLRQIIGSDCVTIRGTITNLKPNALHALHIHTSGDTSSTCTSAGGHFNPFALNHGAPNAQTRHVGDLGNVPSDARGIAKVYISDALVKLSGPTSVIGRSFVVHEGVDDLGLGGDAGSLSTGNAGGRRACGPIGITSTGYPAGIQDVSTVPVQEAVAVVYKAGSFVEPTYPVESVGIIRFVSQEGGQGTRITGQVTGLTPGLHGFHVHELGDVADMCRQAAGHYNPFSFTHAAQSASTRHVGDLGNIMADESGTANIDLLDQQVLLTGQTSILGRAVVVHAGQDDLGLGGDAESLKTGNAGARVACGVVALVKE